MSTVGVIIPTVVAKGKTGNSAGGKTSQDHENLLSPIKGV
jgi:hypothetical protein